MSVSEELKQSKWLQAEEVSFPDEASLAVKCQETAAKDHEVKSRSFAGSQGVR